MDTVILIDGLFSIIGGITGVLAYKFVKRQLWRGLKHFLDWSQEEEVPNEEDSEYPKEIPIELEHQKDKSQ